MKTKHKNIPIFIPHLGCPNDCAFCNQRRISGRTLFDPETVEAEIETALATLPPDGRADIAFFGGSFTGIDRDLMLRLLSLAEGYVGAGRVEGIRLSTRPDYIDKEILTLLGRYTVRTIELGIQSFDERVLAACRRGHTALQAETACRLVKEAGFQLIGQMMTGLPDATGESERMTAERICALGADGARIYPTVVLRGTELHAMLSDGRYHPLSEEEAVARATDVLAVFLGHDVPVLRIGLQSSEGMTKEHAVAGYHPAMGELVKGELYYRRLCELLSNHPQTRGSRPCFAIPRGELSCVIGQKGENRRRLCERFNLSGIRLVETDAVAAFTVRWLQRDSMPSV
ncbi:MAG: radical SAM protein [Ruminococcaceae bacterium]|nr:radical SAM protein [Oscillospiraceae bacterium]